MKHYLNIGKGITNFVLGHDNDQCPKVRDVSAMGGSRRNESNTYNFG